MPERATIEYADRAVLTLDELAQSLRVSWRTAFRLVQTGAIRGLRVGQQWRIRRTELDRYLQAQEQVANPPRQIVVKPQPKAVKTRGK